MEIYLLIMSSSYLFEKICAENTNNLVIDYFSYKEVSSIIGFSCYDATGDLSLMKGLNRNNILAAIHKSDLIPNISSFASTHYWKIGVLLDTRCFEMEKFELFFNEATNYRMFDELHNWLIVSDSLTNFLAVINDRAFGYSTDFVIAVAKNYDAWELYDVYNIFKERGAILNITFYGNWEYETGLSVHLFQPKCQRRANLHHLPLKAMFYKSRYKSPKISLQEYYEDYNNPTKDGQSKFGYHLLSHLSDIYNFTLKSEESPEWKKEDKIGPMERSLVNHTIDFAGTPSTMTIPRTFIMKYVHQDWLFRSSFFFRNPQPSVISMNEIFRPLADEVWCLMVSFMMTSVITLFITQCNHHTHKMIEIFSDSFLMMFGAICQQSTETVIERISTRIAFLFSMIFSLLMYNYYSAIVVSARLDKPIFKINNSLNQLGKLKLKMASEDMVYLNFLFKKNDWDAVTFYENYWTKLPKSEQFLSTDVGMRLVQQGGFAYHTHVETGYLFIDRFFNHREICELKEVDVGGPFMTTFAVPFNCTFVEIARVGLIKISETGLRLRQLMRWSYKKPPCRKGVLTASSITIYEFIPHLILLLIGLLMASIAYVLEIIITRRIISPSSGTSRFARSPPPYKLRRFDIIFP